MKHLLTLLSAIILFSIGCQKMLEEPKTVKASFNYTIDSSKDPISVKFTNTSTGANSFKWDFGNGAASTELSPSTEYASSILYHVKLTAYNGSESDTSSQNVSIPFLLKTVVVIYLMPSDVQYDSTYKNALVNGAQTLQIWYKQQMNGNTYKFANPSVQILKSTKPSSWFIQNPNGNAGYGNWFSNSRDQVKLLLDARYNPLHNAFLIGLPINSNTEYKGQGGQDFSVITKETLVKLSGTQGVDSANIGLGVFAHQVGHSFGLPNNTDSTALMFRDHITHGSGLYKFPDCVLLPNEKATLKNTGFFF